MLCWSGVVGEQDPAGEVDMNSDTQIIVGLVQMVRSDSLDDKIVMNPKEVKKKHKEQTMCFDSCGQPF